MRHTLYFAGGCFWGTQKFFDCIKGVLATRVGYANGSTENPTYEQVCRQDTGHAETVEVLFEDTVLPLPLFLHTFYQAVDPTSVNRQGPDSGPQYRTGIYYLDARDEPVIRDSLAQLQRRISAPVAIQCQRLEQFYEAEDYHQKYLEKNPGGYCHISPEQFELARSANRSR